MLTTETKAKWSLILPVLLFAASFSFNVNAQIRLSAYMDMGESNVSEGFFMKSAITGAWHYEKFIFEGGVQFDPVSPMNKAFTGSFLKAGREFEIKGFPITAHAFFMYNPFSKLVHETNWGVIANAHGRHFFYRLGTNFRTYSPTKHFSGGDDNDSGTKSRIRENWNIMYLVGYNLKPEENEWNIGLTFTNIDNFLISQETNPAFYLHGKYDISSPLTLYAEAWYKSAGAFNISVNYFGFFFRTGVIWKPELNK